MSLTSRPSLLLLLWRAAVMHDVDDGTKGGEGEKEPGRLLHTVVEEAASESRERAFETAEKEDLFAHNCQYPMAL